MVVLSYCLILLFIPLAQCQGIPMGMQTYIPLIMNIRHYYKVSTVFYLHAKYDNRDLEIRSIMHMWSRALSKFGIITGEVVFSELHTIKFYYRRIVRPLFIVILSENGVAEFSNATRHFDMAFPVWFVVFIDVPGNVEHCHHPVGNPFNVVFNTEMVVTCSDDTVLREWYSIDENRTEISDLAVWSKDKGLVFLTRKSLYDRRNDMRGLTMRAVIVKNAPFVRYDATKSHQLRGIFGWTLRELSKALNFTIEIVKEVADYGNHIDGNWSGAIAELYLGNADIGIGGFSMTTRRLEAVDFTLPLIISKNCMYIRETGIWLVQWLAYFEVLSLGIWIAIFLVIITSSAFIAFIKVHTRANGTGYLQFMLENCLNVWGFFCQQGLSDFPEELPLRITFFSVSVTGLVAYAAYSASLISFLTVSVRSLPFLSLEGFVKDGSYKLIVFRGSAEYDFFLNSKNPITSKAMTFMKNEDYLPRTFMEGFHQACHERVAFYTSSEVKKLLDPYLPCRLIEIDAGRIDNLALILSKHNQFNDLINYHLQKFVDNGMLNRLKALSTSRKRETERYYTPVDIRSILPALVALAIGFVMCSLVFLTEKHYYHMRKKAMASVSKVNLFPVKHRRKRKRRNSHYRLYY